MSIFSVGLDDIKTRLSSFLDSISNKSKPISAEASVSKSASSKTSEDDLAEFKQGYNLGGAGGDLPPEIDSLREQYDTELSKLNSYQEKLANLEEDLLELEEKQRSYKEKLENCKNPNGGIAKYYQKRLEKVQDKIGDVQSNISKVESNIEETRISVNKVRDGMEKAVKAYDKAKQAANTQASTTSTNSSAAAMTTDTKTSVISSELASKLDSKYGAGFSKKVETVAANVNCNPNDLLAMMQSESGINAHAQNPSGAYGIIQFMPQTIANLGYTRSQLESMNEMQQLDVAEKYLIDAKRTGGFSRDAAIDTGTLYALCFLPGVSKNETLCSSSGSLSWAYNSNSGLDKDKDGKITKTDLAKHLNEKFSELN